MGATIREVLADKDYFPPELYAQAKNLYEALLVYTGFAERAVSGVVRDRMALKLDREEAGAAIGKILDVQEDVETRAAEAFAIISADFPARPAEVKDEPAAPTPPEPGAPAPTPPPPAPPPPSPPAPPVKSIEEQIKEKLNQQAGTATQPPATQGPITSETPAAPEGPGLSSTPVV